MRVTLPADTDPVAMEELRRLTNIVFDSARKLLRRCTDFDVTFVPLDLLADDPYAEVGHDVNVGWTLGHLIVHVTAGAEESAALAAERRENARPPADRTQHHRGQGPRPR